MEETDNDKKLREYNDLVSTRKIKRKYDLTTKDYGSPLTGFTTMLKTILGTTIFTGSTTVPASISITSIPSSSSAGSSTTIVPVSVPKVIPLPTRTFQQVRAQRRQQLYNMACYKIASLHLRWTNLVNFLTFCHLSVYDQSKENKDKCCKLQQCHLPTLEHGLSTKDYIQQLIIRKEEKPEEFLHEWEHIINLVCGSDTYQVRGTSQETLEHVKM